MDNINDNQEEIINEKVELDSQDSETLNSEQSNVEENIEENNVSNLDEFKKLKEENIDILKIYFCPHNEKDHGHCKKPKPGMIEQAKKDFLIDMNNSIYIGDSQVDYLLAKHFNLTFYGINYNGDNVKSYRGILEISKQIKKIQNK